MKPSTIVLAGAMKVLSNDVQSRDGVANRALEQASGRLYELQDLLERVKEHIEDFLARRDSEDMPEIYYEIIECINK